MPPSACSNRPRRSSVGAGKCALFVTEQLGLEQVGRERGRVERNERLGGARAVTVQGARDQFLAGAGLAGDQHRHARARQPADGAKHFLHRRRVAEHLRDAARLGGGSARRAAPGEAARRTSSIGLIDVERLRQVFERAALVGRHRAVEIGVRGHDDHRQARPLGADLLEQLESAAARHADVGHQHVGLVASQRVQRRPPPLRTASSAMPPCLSARSSTQRIEASSSTTQTLSMFAELIGDRTAAGS